jgi:hypothetical protein
MPSQQLDLLQRRVRYLDGKVAEVQRDLAALEADETATAARTGNREGGAGQIARWVLTRNPVGLVAEALNVTLFQSRADRTWEAFDRRWAQRTGPKIRTMMSALASLEQLGGTAHRVDMLSYPQNEQATALELWARGNRLAREAARLHGNWIATPMSRYDEANRSIGSRWLQRLVLEGNPLVVTVTALSGRTASQAAERTAQGITGAVQTTGAALQQSSTADILRRGTEQQEPQEESGGRTNWWSGVVTAALVVAGGFLVVKIVQDVVAKKPAAEEEEE